MDTVIETLEELRTFYRRTILCDRADWKIICGPESVNTLTWIVPLERLNVVDDIFHGTARVVKPCQQSCNGCHGEIIQITNLTKALSLEQS